MADDDFIKFMTELLFWNCQQYQWLEEHRLYKLQENHLSMIKSCIKGGADITATNDKGQTVFDCLNQQDCLHLEQWLAENVESFKPHQREPIEQVLMKRLLERKELQTVTKRKRLVL